MITPPPPYHRHLSSTTNTTASPLAAADDKYNDAATATASISSNISVAHMKAFGNAFHLYSKKKGLLMFEHRGHCSCTRWPVFGRSHVHSASNGGSHEIGTVWDIPASKEDSEYRKWQNGGGIFHRSASVDPSAIIETGAVVHSGSVLEADVHVGSGAVVGPSVSVGKYTKIGYNAALSNCHVGASCIIHHGVCIGQDGFGFFVDGDGCVRKKPQTLAVRIGNDVELGANTCIDRGSWRDTTIGDHCKVDNLVQIGHNVILGKACILCGQVGIAGSATIGDYVTMGGRAMVRDHVTIASKVRLAANSGVTKDITTPGDYAGIPAIPVGKWRRQAATLQRFYKKFDSENHPPFGRDD